MKIKDTRGLTLIELLISISILSIISLAFFSTINTSIKTNKKNETDIKAMHLAQSEVENLRIQIKKSTGSTLDLVDLKDNKITTNTDNYYTSEEYKVKIKITEKEDLLYEIRVTVDELNSNFSKKKTEIITQIIKGRGLK